MTINQRNQLIPTLSRLSPALVILTVFVNAVAVQSMYSLYLAISFSAISFSNIILKNFIAKPLLGDIGSRPSGATSCSLIINGIKALSYGMPSGHSQIIWAASAYLIIKVLHDDENTWIKRASIVACLLCIAGYVLYSRVAIEGCHTWWQVIIGGFIGIVMGFGVWSLEPYILHSS